MPSVTRPPVSVLRRSPRSFARRHGTSPTAPWSSRIFWCATASSTRGARAISSSSQRCDCEGQGGAGVVREGCRMRLCTRWLCPPPAPPPSPGLLPWGGSPPCRTRGRTTPDHRLGLRRLATPSQTPPKSLPRARGAVRCRLCAARSASRRDWRTARLRGPVAAPPPRHPSPRAPRTNCSPPRTTRRRTPPHSYPPR